MEDVLADVDRNHGRAVCRASMYRRRGLMCRSGRTGRRLAVPPTWKGWALWSRDCSRCRPVWWCSRRVAVTKAWCRRAHRSRAALSNPRQVRQVAGAIGRLAKTVAIDAAVIGHFAQAVRSTARPLPDGLALRLVELMAWRPSSSS
jgi:hypothetical protein